MTKTNRLEVMQADRDAAADWYKSQGEDETVLCDMRDGKLDWQAMVQALARHRIETNTRTGDTGWLIEHEDEPKWLTLKPGEASYEVCWTKESNDALRFARRVDAEDYASAFMDEGPIRITEHRWD